MSDRTTKGWLARVLRGGWWGGLLVGALASFGVAAAQSAADELIHFTAGTPASAAEVNFNFDLIQLWLEGKADLQLVPTDSTMPVYDPGNSGEPLTRVNAYSFHTLGLGGGQLVAEGASLDANTTIRLGAGNAGGMGIQDVSVAKNLTVGGKLTVDGQLVRSQPLDIGLETVVCQNAFTCKCPGTKKALGGGASCSTTGWEMYNNHPSGDNGWTGRCWSGSGENYKVLRTWVICADVE